MNNRHSPLSNAGSIPDLSFKRVTLNEPPDPCWAGPCTETAPDTLVVIDPLIESFLNYENNKCVISFLIETKLLHISLGFFFCGMMCR